MSHFKKLVFLLVLLVPLTCLCSSTLSEPIDYSKYIVQQSDYNCIPASLEMIYKMYGVNDVSQYKIRNEMVDYSGPIYLYDMEEYMDKHFDYEEISLCCEDRFINNLGEYPVLLLVNAKVLSIYVNYEGHAIVGVPELLVKEENKYLKILDPDGGYSRYENLITLLKAIKAHSSNMYVVKGVK